MTRDTLYGPHIDDQCAQAWGEVFEASARWLCEQRPHQGLESTVGGNIACDWCADTVYRVAMETEKLLVVYGWAAYEAGIDGLPEDQAARRALRALVDEARKVEGLSVQLAELDRLGWWRSLREHMGDLLEVFGSAAYAAGRDGVPEEEAPGRSVQAMAARAKEIDAGMIVCADGWWRLQLDHNT